jgi:hypothetical protein
VNLGHGSLCLGFSPQCQKLANGDEVAADLVRGLTMASEDDKTKVILWVCVSVYLCRRAWVSMCACVCLYAWLLWVVPCFGSLATVPPPPDFQGKPLGRLKWRSSRKGASFKYAADDDGDPLAGYTKSVEDGKPRSVNSGADASQSYARFHEVGQLLGFISHIHE